VIPQADCGPGRGFVSRYLVTSGDLSRRYLRQDREVIHDVGLPHVPFAQAYVGPEAWIGGVRSNE
jgi:hypothetical protein